MSSIKNIRFQLKAVTLLTIGLSCIFQSAHAQEEVDTFTFPKTNTIFCGTVSDNDTIIIIDDSYPEYPGGISEMRRFLEENIVYPADSVEGKVYVSVVVDTLGRVMNVKIKKSLSPLADAEVSRVVKLMIFKPALVNGKPVNSRIHLPCSFTLGRNEE